MSRVKTTNTNIENPFGINVLEGQELTITMIQWQRTPGVASLYNWYLVDHENKKHLLISNVNNNSVSFVVPKDVMGLILAYIPSE